MYGELEHNSSLPKLERNLVTYRFILGVLNGNVYGILWGKESMIMMEVIIDEKRVDPKVYNL